MSSLRAIFIGTSAGGITALQNLLNQIGRYPLPIVVVLHYPQNAQLDPQLIFGCHSCMELKMAEEKETIEPGKVYFATPGYHLLIEQDLSLSLSQDGEVNHARPSIDVLFESAARSLGSAACGIILTGANYDGAEGLLAIHDSGGYTIIQDPKSANISTMPQAAFELVDPSFSGDLSTIGQHLQQLREGVLH